jgi:hypothetical protein
MDGRKMSYFEVVEINGITLKYIEIEISIFITTVYQI